MRTSKSGKRCASDTPPQMDFVFTVCDSAAGEACPVWPGHPMTAHWGFEDAAAVDGTNVEKERAFIALPVKSLDAMTLKAKLDDIGRLEGATATAGEAK